MSRLGTVSGSIVSMLTVSTGRMFRRSPQQQLFFIRYNLINAHAWRCAYSIVTCAIQGGGVGGWGVQQWPDLWKMVPSGVLLLYLSPQLPRV